MPMYEFKCNDCGTEFETLKQVGDYIEKCPACESSNTEKVVSAASFSVVGSTNRSLDSVIGEDAERKWQQINAAKQTRDKNNYGITGKEVDHKENQRLGSLLNRQQQAYGMIDKAKQEAGITKKDELKHLLKG